MEKIRAFVQAFSALSPRRKALACVAVALIVALAVGLCISINMRSNIQRQYAAARNQIGEALYSNLNILMQTFNMTSVPNTDVANVILPQMRDYYVASVTLNNLLGQIYGPRYRVLSDTDVDNLTNAFAAYETAFRDNAPTDLAQSNMQACMDRVRELLASRYSQGVLKPGR